jgi:hypothetical protein
MVKHLKIQGGGVENAEKYKAKIKAKVERGA